MKESSYNKLIAVLGAIAAVLVVLFFSVVFLLLCVDTLIPRILIWIGVKKRPTPRSITIVLEDGPGDAIVARDVTKL